MPHWSSLTLIALVTGHLETQSPSSGDNCNCSKWLPGSIKPQMYYGKTNCNLRNQSNNAGPQTPTFLLSSLSTNSYSEN